MYAIVQITTIQNNLDVIKKCGYQILDYFSLPEDAWWEFYYAPLEKRLTDLRIKFKHNPKALAIIAEDEIEIALFRKYNAWYGSVFFVMQKQ